MDARASVQAGLDHLASRLSEYIASVLSPELNGLPWTTVLSELDRAKGYAPKTYSASDLQPQLRILTERLGKLGYPFSDPTRTVSVLGGELRIVRNRWAHNDEFTSMDVWRAHDFVVRLLSHIRDEAGLPKAQQLRSEALERVIKESGLAPDTRLSPRDTPEAVEDVSPSESVLTREDSSATPTIGGDRLQFEPWSVVPVGDISILDELPGKRAKEEVRAVAIDIVDNEGPIQIDRLARLTAQSFGVARLHTARERKIVKQIKALGYRIDSHKFVWPHEIDRDKWTEFRPNPSTTDRPFEEVSPVEIANAARFLLQVGPLSDDDLEAKVLQTFGRSRRTRGVKSHLDTALGYGLEAGVMTHTDGVFEVR